MEYKPTFITVDEPFMSQQAFRDFLKLPSEYSAQKIGLYDLLEVAKVVIRDELVSCGCSENELTGFRIECQVLKDESKELRETYLVEWKQTSQSEQVTKNKDEMSEHIANEKSKVNLERNIPLSFEFIGKLTERLHEVSSISEGGQLISNQVNFSRSDISLRSQPGCAKYTDGRKYQAILSDEGEVLKWKYRPDNKTMILCDDGGDNIPIL
jgi:hypothetical protein